MCISKPVEFTLFSTFIVYDLYVKRLQCLHAYQALKFSFLYLPFFCLFFWLLLVRDFQFGHMDGNDYINTLLME